MEDPGRSTAPAGGLTLRLELPKRTYSPGDRIEGTLVMTNTSGATARFSAMRDRSDDGTLIADSGWAASARTGTDAIMMSQYEIRPGATARHEVVIRTEACGFEQSSYEPLAPGHYRAMAEVHWTTDSATGHWWSPLVDVTLAG